MINLNRSEADKIINGFLKPIYGFALKRCRNSQDAEDLSQEIALKAFQVLTARDDILDPPKFIWTVAHNALANYYRDGARRSEYEIVGLPPEDVIGGNDPADDDSDIITRLCSEIAYLSKLQRQIVVGYYFDGRKQSELAESLGIPVGTVKWHLFEAKKELKRGMDMERKSSELRFAPVDFSRTGFCGSIGNRPLSAFFGTALPRNICYSVKSGFRSVNEIADELGVSPVYVESEIERLEENGFLVEKGGKYIANFIINEPTAELLALRDEMYKKAAAIFANELFDELTSSGLLSDPDIACGQTDGEVTMTSGAKRDDNFILWALIPFIAAMSGSVRERIRFDEVATIRPDGGVNIFSADVKRGDLKLPEGYIEMRDWNGPMWNGDGENMLWQVDSEWSERKDEPYYYVERAKRVLSLWESDELSKEDAAWLAERGYVKTCGDPEETFKVSWQIVMLLSPGIKKKLIALGDGIRERNAEEFERLKAPYVSAALDAVPKHLRRVCEYELQFLFASDGWFILHCLKALLANGKLKPPTDGQRKALSILIASEK